MEKNVDVIYERSLIKRTKLMNFNFWIRIHIMRAS